MNWFPMIFRALTQFARPGVALPALLISMIFAGVSPAAAATTYYVSQSFGNDAWDGLAAAADGGHGPWKTLAKASSVTFGDGDQLLLRCGDIWNEELTLHGFGSARAPAVLSSYGGGNRPKIDRRDSTRAAFKKCVFINGNAHGWKIANLELANACRGIQAVCKAASQEGDYLWIENVYVHDCKFGRDFQRTDGDQNDQQIGISVSGGRRSLKGLVVKNCVFSRNFVGTRIFHVQGAQIIGNVYAESEWTGMWQGGDHCLIARNKFLHNCERFVWCGVSAIGFAMLHDSTVEYNEFSETQRPNSYDGEDVDYEGYNSDNILRYNTMHDGAGPSVMLYNNAKPALRAFEKNESIYGNVFYHCGIHSQVDGCIYLNGGTRHSAVITHNMIYLRPGFHPSCGLKQPGVKFIDNFTPDILTERKGRNLALGASATASSTSAGSPAGVADDQPGTAWTAATSSGEWVQLDFGAVKTIDQVVVRQANGSAIKNFVLQRWDAGAGAWDDIYTSDLAMPVVAYMPFAPIQAAKIRLLINGPADGLPAVAEFQVYHGSIGFGEANLGPGPFPARLALGPAQTRGQTEVRAPVQSSGDAR